MEGFRRAGHIYHTYIVYDRKLCDLHNLHQSLDLSSDFFGQIKTNTEHCKSFPINNKKSINSKNFPLHTVCIIFYKMTGKRRIV